MLKFRGGVRVTDAVSLREDNVGLDVNYRNLKLSRGHYSHYTVCKNVHGMHYVWPLITRHTVLTGKTSKR